MRKPNLFIPGFPKSGTSALHSALVQHPEICMGNTKEPHTYSWDNRFKNKEIYFKENYGSLSSKYILDSSTSYMVSENALKRIIKDTPNAKFIIVARDPIDRIVSHYNWLSSKNLVNKKPLDELRDFIDCTFNFYDHYKGNYKTYIDSSMYGKHIKNLLELTKRENILFLVYEELFENFDEQKLKIGHFLNLDLSQIKVEKVNKTSFKENRKSFKNPLLSSLLFMFRKSRRFKNKIKFEIRVLKGHPRGKNINSPVQYKTTREEIAESIFPLFENDIKLLLDLGFDIKSWPSYSILNKSL